MGRETAQNRQPAHLLVPPERDHSQLSCRAVKAKSTGATTVISVSKGRGKKKKREGQQSLQVRGIPSRPREVCADVRAWTSVARHRWSVHGETKTKGETLGIAIQS